MRELLELLAATKPLVLILDDLHWADSGSIELIGSLLRRPPSAPVLIAMAVRPRQVPERLAGAFERAHRAGRLTRLELSAFSLEEARELLGGGVDAAALYEESGGNPFYLEQLARSLDLGAAPLAASTSVGGVEVPPAVAAALAEELALLSEEARRMLEGAAVAGDPFEPELMAAAAGVDTAAAVEALDELLRRDLVRPQTCRAAFASGTRSSAGRSTKPRPAAGVSAPISEAPRRWPRAARRRRHARTTSSAPPRRATTTPSRFSARPAKRPRSARRQARHAGSRRPCGCSATPPRRRNASSC